MIALINLVILVFLFVGFGREYWRNIEIERDIAALQAENDRLAGQQLESLALIGELSSEYYLEAQARTKRGMGEPGEHLIIVDLSLEVDNPELGSDADNGDNLSNPARWWNYFFNRTSVESAKPL